jgi:hypothetical protein
MPGAACWARTLAIPTASVTSVNPRVDPRSWAAPPASGIRRSVALPSRHLVTAATSAAAVLLDVRQPVIEMARRSGLLDELGEGGVFHTVDAAVDALTAIARRASPAPGPELGVG